MATSIGQVHCEASTAKMVELGIPLDTIWTWEEMKPGDGQAPAEAGAKAVLLYALDLMAAAGVTPAEAAAQLRAGRAIEEVCAMASVERSAGSNPPKIVIGPPGCGADGCVKPYGHDGMCVDSTGQSRITKEWLAKNAP